MTEIEHVETGIMMPEKCLVCGESWSGGHTYPPQNMTEGLRVFYSCGASMSVKILNHGVYSILFKNCEYDLKAVRND